MFSHHMNLVNVAIALLVGFAQAQDSPNIKAVEDMCMIMQEMSGQMVNQGLMERLMPRLMWHYAARIDCNQVGTSAEFGFNLKGASYKDCMDETAKKYKGIQIIDFQCEDIVADQRGKSVMLYQPSTFKLTTGETRSVPIFTKYDFDDQGKIMAYSSQFDTSVFDAAMPAAKNAALVKYQCHIFREMAAGQTISKPLLDKLLPEMIGFYAARINCEEVATSTQFGFSLKNVPVADCFSESTKKWGGLQMIDLRCKDVTVDRNGETVMLYQPSTFRLPTGRMVSLPVVNRYDFNRDGKIVSYSMQLDTSILEAYSSHFAYSPQFDTLVARNSATIRNQCKIMQEMAGGQTIAQPLLDKLTPELMGFYSATVNCNQVASSEKFGFRLKNVPIAACWAEATKKYGGMQIVEWKCEDVTADRTGKHVMLYQPSMFKLATGDMVRVPMLTKYDFDDQGKIMSYSAQFDTSVLEGYGGRLAYNSPYNTPAARNSATVQKQCEIMQRMVGQTISQDTLNSLMPQTEALCTARINCNSVATSPQFGFSLENVPITECFAESARKYDGFHIADWKCADVASDATGKSVILYQPSTFLMPSGQMVNVPILTKYDFNEDGKITAYSSQFDTAALQAPFSKSLAAQEVWSSSILPFCLGCAVAAFGMHMAMKRRRLPLSQEGYNPCA